MLIVTLQSGEILENDDRPGLYFSSFWNFLSGGFARATALKEIERVGQASIQVAQAKQSGMIQSYFRMAPMPVEGHPCAHVPEAMFLRDIASPSFTRFSFPSTVRLPYLPVPLKGTLFIGALGSSEIMTSVVVFGPGDVG